MGKEERKPIYTLCPRCELNYITKKDKLCPVCKAEMGLLDKTILIPDEEDVDRICPVCKVNLLGDDEEICFMCQKERKEDVDEDNPEWTAFRDDEELVEPEIPIALPADDAEVGDEEEAEEFDDEEFDDEPDDFDYNVDPDDFEEDEDEEEDADED